MTYKDQTFCEDWCNNRECFRNYVHIKEAQEPGGYLFKNPWMPISFFIDVPKDCKDIIHKNKDIVTDEHINS